MASRNSKKSSGIRLLWIPGGRKSHPKGRFSSTNKQPSYTTRQKNSQVWSLGGSKAQQNLLEADPSTALLDGPSTSTLVRATAASGASAAAAAASSIQTQCSESHNLLDATSENCSVCNKPQQQQQLQQNSPTTPNSSTSTAPLISPPQSPWEQNAQLSDNSTQPSTTTTTATTTTTMPAKRYQPAPVIITATTNADIMEKNRFTLLGNKDIPIGLDIYSLPSLPTNNLNSQENLNNSSGTTISQITPSGSPHKTDNESHNGSVNNSPVKKKQQQRSNQGDVNSIESITEDTASEKIPSGNLDWIDEVMQEQQDREILTKPKKKKKKKYAKGLDQLDGVPMKENSIDGSLKESLKEEDEKTVKCLYYTLMCCDCTIS